MPAEWAHHSAVWTAWPHAEDQWSEGLSEPRQSLAAMISTIVDLDERGRPRGERVELIVRTADEAAEAKQAIGAAVAGVRFHHFPYGDIWLRDTGPLFLTRPGELIASRFEFDGWGDKYVMDGDQQVAERVTGLAGTPGVAFDFVLEGGAIDVDGEGTVLTTRQCLLHGNRRGKLDESQLDARLRYALGCDKVVWLERGLANDHTDGHVDTLARFVAPGVVVAMEPAAGDPNRDALLELLADLRAATGADGRKLEVVAIPSPGEVLNAAGELLPASYTNFYIANSTVVVPTYGVAADEAAVRKLSTLFPGRRTVGVPGKAVVVGGGAFHCSTQQQPSVPPV